MEFIQLVANAIPKEPLSFLYSASVVFISASFFLSWAVLFLILASAVLISVSAAAMDCLVRMICCSSVADSPVSVENCPSEIASSRF